MSGSESEQGMAGAAGSSEAWCPGSRSVFPGNWLRLLLRTSHPVSPLALCLVQCLIGTRDHGLGRVPMVRKLRNTSADGDLSGSELLLRHSFPNSLSQLG